MFCTIKIKDMVIEYELIRKHVKNPRLEFVGQHLYLIVPFFYNSHDKVLKKHSRWIYNRYSRMQRIEQIAVNVEPLKNREYPEFREIVHSLVDNISEELGVRPRRTGFRKMISKWGSCSSKGNININSYMMYLPYRMIEYVVFHEMVHLIELNHSPRFWSYVKERFSDYTEYEELLSAYWSLIKKEHIYQSL